LDDFAPTELLKIEFSIYKDFAPAVLDDLIIPAERLPHEKIKFCSAN